jgi:hypothetical protein
MITRRSFLVGGAATALLGVMDGHKASASQLMASLNPTATRPVPVSYTFPVERPTDLLQLDVTFTGFTKVLSGGRLTALTPGAGSFITVQFPPQAIGEAAYPYIADPWGVDPPPVLSVIAGPSRLCFKTGSPVDFSNPMTVTDLLNWQAWTLLVPAVAAATPAANATSIEYPYALYLSPAINPKKVGAGGPASAISGPVQQVYATFAGRSEPLVSTAGVADCWTASYEQTAYGIAEHAMPTVAAIWARDYGAVTQTGETSVSYED